MGFALYACQESHFPRRNGNLKSTLIFISFLIVSFVVVVIVVLSLSSSLLDGMILSLFTDENQP